ncbi:KAP family P-loop NTPase fold protein [Hahella ganghwensis]|uniref:KAP family P-loop NTPase fold protein n=1 Tax=Hahella ganghwensis TaxID=286420 RepID=UPI00036D2A64|nr:P-loop NTPase fold protein [Hahella ganghwensis]
MAPSAANQYSAWVYCLPTAKTSMDFRAGTRIPLDTFVTRNYTSQISLNDFVLIWEQVNLIALGLVIPFSSNDSSNESDSREFDGTVSFAQSKAQEENNRLDEKLGPGLGIQVIQQIDPGLNYEEIAGTGIFDTFDPSTPDARLIPLTERQWHEILNLLEKRIDIESFKSLFAQLGPYQEIPVASEEPGDEPKPAPPGPKPDPKKTINDLDHKTGISYDSPFTEDELSRSPIAQGLAVTLNNLYRDSREDAKDSFRIHLHGMWGSGKSTFMRLLGFALQPSRTRKDPDAHKYISLLPESAKHQDWVIVNFNAWQQQRLEPIWWSLYQTIYSETCDSLFTSPSFDLTDEEIARNQCRHNIQNAEKQWRESFRGPWKSLAALGVVTTIIALIMIFTGKDATTTKNILGLLLSAFSIPLVVFNLYKLREQDPAQASRQEATVFARKNDDPLQALRTRFKALVTEVNGPIMVYVDDLDRCNADYVIELLEVIQTVFNDSRVYYLIAADRRWVHTAYETVYPDMMESIREPGKDMGSLFLEKIFQMDVTIPEISQEQKATYFDTLLARQKDGMIPDSTKPTVEEITRETSAGVDAMLLRLTNPDLHPVMRQAISNKAAVEINSREAQKQLEHFLKPFGTFLASNPRAMKRYVNAYTMILTIGLVLCPTELGDEDNQKKLALWMIIITRWPSAIEQIRIAVTHDAALDFQNNDALKSIDPDLFARVWNGNAENINVSLDSESALLFLRLTHRT